MTQRSNTMTPRSATTDSQPDLREVLTTLVQTLESIDRRLHLLEAWVNEWEAADAWVEQQLIEYRDKTRDH